MAGIFRRRNKTGNRQIDPRHGIEQARAACERGPSIGLEKGGVICLGRGERISFVLKPADGDACHDVRLDRLPGA